MNKNEKQVLDHKVVELIFKSMCLENINIIDAAKISLIFSYARNAEDIKNLIHIFSHDYPFLAKITDAQAEEIQENQEKIIEDFIRQSIKSDPTLGSKIAQEVSKNKNISISELAEKFPEFKSFIKK